MTARKNRPSRLTNESLLEYVSMRATRWVGSPASLVFHTAMFIISFLLYFLGVPFNTILLVLTTIVSLEAIYLSIFIQMSVNRQAQQLEEVSEDVEEIQEDVEEIQEDIDEIQEDVEDIQEDEDESTKDVAIEKAVLERIEFSLKSLGEEISEMRRRNAGGK